MEFFDERGYARVPGVLSPERIAEILGRLPELGSAAGTRGLLHHPIGRELANDPAVRGLAEAALGRPAIPVRAILFDKSPAANWTLGMHQDTKIAVRERREVPGYDAWSQKEGTLHCRPPERILRGMVAVRLHLDRSHAENGPLRVSPGTHRLGIVPPGEIEATVAHHGDVALLAEVGDAILMAPLTLHGSGRSVSSDRRRVLHIEYASEGLDGDLEWAFA